jgi:hypothetical protein
MSRIAIPEALLVATFEQLRVCGDGQRECVAYWVASMSKPDEISRVVHPLHTSGPFGYEVESDYVNRLFLELRTTNETVRLQVHTHPGLANHSETDDTFALAPSAGFLSLVIPGFAQGPIGFEGSHLVEMDGHGEWRQVEGETVLDLT